MAVVRQEKNLVNEILTASGANITRLDTGQFSGTVTYWFEVVAKVASGTLTVGLHNETSNISTLTFTETSYTRKRVQFTGEIANCTVTLSGGTTPMVKAARIIVLQDTGANPLTKTETEISVGSRMSNTSTTYVALTNPKYYYHDASKWDGTVAAFFESVATSSSTKTASPVKLQRQTTPPNNWTDWTDVVTNDHLTTTPGRIRTAFTLTDTLSLVMTSCGGTSMVIVLRLTLTIF